MLDHILVAADHPNIKAGMAGVQLIDPDVPADSLKALHPTTATYSLWNLTGRTYPSVPQSGVDSRGHRYRNGFCANIYCHSSGIQERNWGNSAREPETFTPLHGSIGAPVTEGAVVTFAEAMDPASIDSTTFSLEGVAGSVTYDPETRTARFTPAAPLGFYSEQTATLTTGVRNLAGVPLPRAYTWSFTAEQQAPFQTILSEPFASGTMPSGWSSLEISGYETWAVFNDGLNQTGGNGGYVARKNVYSGGEAELRTPLLDLTAYRSVELQFRIALRFSTPLEMFVEVSTSGAAGPWTIVWHGGNSNDHHGLERINISSQTAGQGAVMVRFRSNRTSPLPSDYCELDDVLISGAP